MNLNELQFLTDAQTAPAHSSPLNAWFIFLWTHPLPLLPVWIPAFLQLSSQSIDMALVLLKVRQQIFVHCPFLQPPLERSKYKSGADASGFVL